MKVSMIDYNKELHKTYRAKVFSNLNEAHSVGKHSLDALVVQDDGLVSDTPKQSVIVGKKAGTEAVAFIALMHHGDFLGRLAILIDRDTSKDRLDGSGASLIEVLKTEHVTSALL